MYTIGGHVSWYSHHRTVWRLPTVKLKIQLSYDPATHTSGYRNQKKTKKTKSLSQRDINIYIPHRTPTVFTAVLFTIARTQKLLKGPSTDE